MVIFNEKKKGEKMMINKINKKFIIILLITMFFAMLFPIKANAATYNTRTSLYNAGKNAVGNTVRIYRSGTSANDAFEQDHESSQVYCVQHNVTTIKKKYYDYKVKNYIKISGNVATNSNGKSVTSNKNLALAYIIDQEGLRKGYVGGSSPDEVRNLAVKHYLTTGGWMSSVGTALGVSNDDINYYNVKNADRGAKKKQNVLDFVNRAIKYSNDYAKSQSRTTIDVEMWLCVKSNAKQNLLIVKSSNFVETPKGELTINKVDANTNQALAAGFKIQTSAGKWLSGSNGSYNYNNTFAKAQTYTSSVTLNGLKYDTYKVYEVKAPNGYDLADQAGYDKKNKWVYFGTAKINASSTKVTKRYTNVQKMSIKGYVWIDTQATKDGAFNSLYDSSRESRVAGVTVKLINKSTKKAIAEVKTNANGEYTFNKLLTQAQLKDYYVEFNYKGVKIGMKDAAGKDYQEDISKYIPVAINTSAANGSKAIMNSVAEKDSDLSGIATTYAGTNATEISKYGLEKCGALSNGVLSNINLGIKKIPNADYNLAESLEYVKITMKGYTYTYKYGKAGKATYTAAPNDNWQKVGTISGYTANIYPSDIAYESKNGKEDLKVDVRYRIDITNTTTNGTGDAANNYNELYKEKTLHISKLTDRFDTKRYKLNDSNWTEKDGTATIKDEYLKDIKDNGIASSKAATKYITFSVNRSAILDILKHPYGIIEKYPTTASTTGYHKYTRNDYSWQNNLTKEQTHRTVNDSREASAPYLIFKLGKEKRTISGRVFEDTVTDESKARNEKLGNGVYNNEKGVSGVKVQLLDVSVKDNKEITDITKLSVSDLYDLEDDQKTVKDPTPAETTTDANGNYTLTGIVPGDYYLRFIYGNGEYKITDLDGNVINEGNINAKIGDKEISAKDYKSTIVVNSAAKNALKGIENEETVKPEEFIKEGATNKKNYIWYQNLKDVNASVALDNLNTRIAVNQGSLQNMIAGTAKLSIRVESDINNATDVKGTNNVTENAETISDGENTANVKVEYLNEMANQNAFAGLNLGIIEMPNQEAKLEKIITKMKLVNAQNNKVFEGNPETDKMQGVSDLDNSNNGGSTYVRAELQDEIITGATLELTYEIRVTNISDVNYYNNEYYWFGEANKNKEVTLVVNELVDYLDETLQFNKEASPRFVVATDTNLAQNDELAKKTIIKLSDNNTKLYTAKNTTRNDNSCKTSDTATLIAQRILSANDDDMEFINQAKLTKLVNGTDNRDNSNEKDTEIQTIKPVSLNYEAQARATITPPTGADRQTIIMYVVAGTLALAILSAGVVVIKKFVVK